MWKNIFNIKHKKLVKYIGVFFLISILVTVATCFVVGESDKSTFIDSPIFLNDIDDIQELEDKNIDGLNQKIKDALQGIEMPWDMSLFLTNHYLIHSDGEIDYDTSFDKTTNFNGWPFKCLYTHSHTSISNPDYVFYSAWEFSPLAFFVNFLLLYVFGSAIIIAVYFLFFEKKKNKKE